MTGEEYAARKAAGRCSICGKPVAKGAHGRPTTMCSKHRKLHRQYAIGMKRRRLLVRLGKAEPDGASRHCSVCDAVGHNRRTCPELKNAQPAKGASTKKPN